jgi:hypothetical protein
VCAKEVTFLITSALDRGLRPLGCIQTKRYSLLLAGLTLKWFFSAFLGSVVPACSAH